MRFCKLLRSMQVRATRVVAFGEPAGSHYNRTPTVNRKTKP